MPIQYPNSVVKISEDSKIESYNFIWNTSTLAWERATGALTGAGNVVTINNFPAVQPISDNGGSITVDSSQLPASLIGGALKVDGTANIQPVSGTISVGNFPGTQIISGSVSISNFPATQVITAASLPLPSNAAKETGGNLDSLPTRLSDSTFTTRH